MLCIFFFLLESKLILLVSLNVISLGKRNLNNSSSVDTVALPPSLSLPFGSSRPEFLTWRANHKKLGSFIILLLFFFSPKDGGT